MINNIYLFIIKLNNISMFILKLIFNKYNYNIIIYIKFFWKK